MYADSEGVTHGWAFIRQDSIPNLESLRLVPNTTSSYCQPDVDLYDDLSLTDSEDEDQQMPDTQSTNLPASSSEKRNQGRWIVCTAWCSYVNSSDLSSLF